MSLSINHYSNLNLKYNPFSFLNEKEQLQIVVPRFKVIDLVKEVENSKTIFVQFYGKKGYGKSTHLSFLAAYFPEAKFVKLKKKRSENIEVTDKLLIIDSFQLLSLKNKINLLRHQKKIIIALHNSYRCFKFLRKSSTYININFNGLDLDSDTLNRILKAKIELATINIDMPFPKLKVNYTNSLFVKHKKNIRAIQMELYSEFLKPNSSNYEI